VRDRIKPGGRVSPLRLRTVDECVALRNFSRLASASERDQLHRAAAAGSPAAADVLSELAGLKSKDVGRRMCGLVRGGERYVWERAEARVRDVALYGVVAVEVDRRTEMALGAGVERPGVDERPSAG
jgi:hypothetical protein